MSTKQQRLDRQDTLTSVYSNATAVLMQIQGVVNVGVGLKEVGGQPTDEICFRVYVQEKQTDPVVNVPAAIQGFPIEVEQIFMAQSGPLEGPGEETIRKDESEHRPVKGGICLSSKSTTEKEHSAGTLGWFATTVPGNSTVLLTCAHVLWPELFDGMNPPDLSDPDKVAQPIYDKTCCCEYHVMGERIVGVKNAEVDCAIASLTVDAGVPALIIGNRSTDVTLSVDGQAVAAIGDKVRKIGKRSGYTEGIVIDVGTLPDGAMVSVPTLPGGTKHGMVKARVNKILIWPTTRAGFSAYFDDHGRQMSFGNAGDSGSVVLDEDNNIVGLYYSSDDMTARRSVSIACHIDKVLDALKAKGHEIKLAKTPGGGNISGIATGKAILPRLQTLRDLVRESSALPAVLYRRHRDEVTRSIEHCRPATVAWHRHQGPAFAAAVNRSHREPAYRIPREIHGVSRHALLIAMARVLAAHGSAALRRDLGEHSFALIDELSRAENVRSILSPAIALELEAATQP
jgi:hypothetical protein